MLVADDVGPRYHLSVCSVQAIARPYQTKRPEDPEDGSDRHEKTRNRTVRAILAAPRHHSATSR